MIMKLTSWQYHKGSLENILEDILYALLLGEVGKRGGGNVVRVWHQSGTGSVCQHGLMT